MFFSGVLIQLINREQSLKNVCWQGSNFLILYLMSKLTLRLTNVIRFLEVFQYIESSLYGSLLRYPVNSQLRCLVIIILDSIYGKKNSQI